MATVLKNTYMMAACDEMLEKMGERSMPIEIQILLDGVWSEAISTLQSV